MKLTKRLSQIMSLTLLLVLLLSLARRHLPQERNWK